jgi:hypothetical protein
VFGLYGVERTFVAMLLHLAATAAFYFALTYFAIVRVVVMKKLEL